MGRVLAEVLANRQESNTFRVAAIEDTGQDVPLRLNRYLPALATIAVVAPLLGLFGTVVGMIEIFDADFRAGGAPPQLARGISIPCYKTGFGIILDIPALIFHRFFRLKAEYFLHPKYRETK